MFSNRLHSPIEIEVVRDKNRFKFTAVNSSQYEYELELEFNLTNLVPHVTSKKFLLHPGKNRLLTLDVKNPNLPPDYSYSSSYSIGNSSLQADPGFPYLFPIKEGKKVAFDDLLLNKLSMCFKVSQRDTVYASRKGIVTAIPGGNEFMDRIIGDISLEVRHEDGTIAIYIGLDKKNCFTDIGRKIYPGQAIGVCNGDQLMFGVVQIKKTKMLSIMNNVFYIEEGRYLKYNETEGMLVVHPENIKERELTKRELKKKTRGQLYE